ncbi:uncharacterized protein LOC111901356 [Lactuca sativa]|uniref:uncharacterized protein LOC111901356 n=1 Tax=Lactuca sativa TaxID=4236 RepID=UPI000CD9DAD9|nr:uncharacterized protein LOC111901356 [Lactuca sativa]
MSNQDNNGLLRSYGNGFPQSSGDDLPPLSQCENVFASLGNCGTRHRLSSTLPPPPPPLTLPTSRVKRYETTQPFWHGPTCYEDTRTVNGIVYEAYKAACYALGLKLKPEAIVHLTLSYIEKSLLICGLSLKQILNMPLPDHKYIQDFCNMLIQAELNYDLSSLEVKHQQLHSKLNDEQKKVYDTIINVVKNEKGGVFFLYGYGGTGKTFVWKTLSATIRSKGEIIINVASSGNATLLLSGGRTVHSRFHIPMNLNEDLFCSITSSNDVVELLNNARLIIWDEAPMMHNHCFKAVDRTHRDVILSSDKNKPFGGKTIVFGGDFRQIIPVIQRENHSYIVQASLHSSRLWRECTILCLNVNTRLLVGFPNNNFKETKSFVEWILKISEGTIGGPNDGEVEIEFPEDVIVPSTCDHIHSIVSTIYSSFQNHLDDPLYFQDKAILVPANEEVNAINDYMLELMKDEGKTYLSSDFLCETEE